MRQEYDTWVVVDPAVKNWIKTVADSIQNAAEQAVLDYDSRADVDYALSKESVVIQVCVKDPSDPDRHAYSFDITCAFTPFYEITGPSAKLNLD